MTSIGNWKWIISTDETIWSEELCRINGWEPALPVPRFEDMQRFYPPESWQRLKGLVTKAINNGEPYEVELDQIRTDDETIKTLAGGEADFDTTGHITGLHGTVQDITERKLIEQKLHDSEELFRSQFENSNIGIAITSVYKGWLQVNPRLCNMFGYSQEELWQKTWAEMTYPDDLEIHLKQFDRVMRR